jgi:hypothetical protein
MKRLVFTWGRFNPPTIGHKKLLDNTARIARFWGADYFIYPSQTCKKPKDPLQFKEKVEWMQKIFPEHASHIVYDTEINTFIKLLQKYQGEYEEVVWVAGSDRVPAFQKILLDYNGKDFTYRKVKCLSAGTRDPDADGAAGMSASKMRAAAAEGDTSTFRKGIPSSLDNSHVIKLMREVRLGMGIK